MINGPFLCVCVKCDCVLSLDFVTLCVFYYLFVLHADKAKGLQINLSEALQGKTPNVYSAYVNKNDCCHTVCPCGVWHICSTTQNINYTHAQTQTHALYSRPELTPVYSYTLHVALRAHSSAASSCRERWSEGSKAATQAGGSSPPLVTKDTSVDSVV